MSTKETIILLFFATLCCSEPSYMEQYEWNARTNKHSTGLEILSEGPCGLIPDWVIEGLSGQCRLDFSHYRDTICNASLSNLENLWAYKSKHLKCISILFCLHSISL